MYAGDHRHIGTNPAHLKQGQQMLSMLFKAKFISSLEGVKHSRIILFYKFCTSLSSQSFKK